MIVPSSIYVDSSDSSDSDTPHSLVKTQRKNPPVSDKRREPTKQMVTRASDTSVPTDLGCRSPSLHSFLVTGKENQAEGLKQTLLRFIRREMFPIHKFFHPIVPFTNSCRMNYQSQQAIRVFFGENCSQRSSARALTSRSSTPTSCWPPTLLL